MQFQRSMFNVKRSPSPPLLHFRTDGGFVLASQKKDSATQSLMLEFKRQRRNFMTVWGPTLVVVVIAFYIAAQFIKPAPPKHVVISTGSGDGAYQDFAQEYAKFFLTRDITLEPRTSAGSMENIARLLDDDSGVTAAIVQGGTATPVAKEKLRTVVSLYLEPVWVFYRSGAVELTQLRQLKGKRIAVGAEGSGSKKLAITLLRENGVVPGAPKQDAPNAASNATSPTPTATNAQVEKQATILSLDTIDAVIALRAGTVDAAVFVISPHAAIVRELLVDPNVKLMSYDRHSAYPRRHPYLSDVTLPKGVLDPATNLPDRDIELIAVAANLVVREDIHSALIPLFIRAAKEVHNRGGLVSEPGRFPTLDLVELPAHEEATRFFENGPSFLHRYLPFWLASFIERTWIMLLPLVTLLFPLLKVAPPVYRWRIRVRIYRWYRVLRAIDQHLGADAEFDALAEDLDKLTRLEHEVADVWVPLSFMEEFYNLRLHIAFTERRVRETLAGKPTTEEDDFDGAIDAIVGE